MRVIGVDPGSRACGYGILESVNGNLRCMASGAIVPTASLSHPRRLKIIYSELSDLIDQFSPDYMSIEEMFFAKNAKSAIKLGQARGVALLAAANNDIEVHEYAPTKIKLALTGRGRANKTEMRKMISYILGVDVSVGTDASDAIAIALCHINISRIGGIEDLKHSTGRRRRRFTLNDLTSKG